MAPNHTYTRLLGGLLLCVFALYGCGESTESPSPSQLGEEESCDGKCDDMSEAQPALEPISLADLGTCRGVKDEQNDEFFALDRVVCDFSEPPAQGGLKIERIYGYATTQDGSQGDVESLGPDDFSTNEVTIAKFRADDYPVTIGVSISFSLSKGHFDSEGQPGFHKYNFGIEHTVASRQELAELVGDNALEVGLPLQMWPVSIWPDTSLRSAWAAGEVSSIQFETDYEIALNSADIGIGGATPTGMLPVSTWDILRSDEPVSALEQRHFYLLVPAEGPMPDGLGIDVTLYGAQEEFTGRVQPEGPGYYVLGQWGQTELTSPSELPGEASEQDGTDETDDTTEPAVPQAGEPLEAVSLARMGTCRGELGGDHETARDQIHCKLPNVWKTPQFEVLRFDTQVHTPAGSSAKETLGADKFGDQEVMVQVFDAANSYPMTIDLSLAFTLASGMIEPGTESPMPGASLYFYKETIEIANRQELEALSGDSAIDVGLPLELWPVSMWPDTAMQQRWADNGILVLAEMAYSLSLSSDGGQLTKNGTAGPLQVNLAGMLRAGTSIDALAQQLIYLPVPLGGTLPEDAKATMRVMASGTDATNPIGIDGPGHYVFDVEANTTLTPAAELPALD